MVTVTVAGPIRMPVGEICALSGLLRVINT
jgi:hypothetical protein